MWELASDTLSNGLVGLIPLYLFTDDAEPRLIDFVRRVDERLQRENLPEAGHAEIWTACHILFGLRYDTLVIQSLFREFCFPRLKWEHLNTAFHQQEA